MKRPASVMDNDAGYLSDETLELPGTRGMSATFKGLNVRPPFAQWLVEGFKTMEVRKYNLGTHGMAPCMWVVKTKANASDITLVLGIVQFDESKVVTYTNRDKFQQDWGKHRIADLTSALGNEWSFEKPLYGWPVKKYIKLVNEIVVDGRFPTRSMLGWIKDPVTLDITVHHDEVEEVNEMMER